MLTILRTLGILFVLTASATTAHAVVLVSEIWYTDAGYEAGGYYEYSVTNNSGGDLYLVMVGNDDFGVIFTRPDLVGLWQSRYCNEAEWGPDCSNFGATDWTPPILGLFSFSDLFPGKSFAIFYYAQGSTPPIADGETMTGFRWIPSSAGGGAASSTHSLAGSPFAVFNGAGDLVEQGTTTGSPVATESSTWGGVKALFR
jgi:hypothetical protein